MTGGDRTLRAYYESERAYLRDLGREFAQAHPELAWLLRAESADPSVERLLQGVAFLTGRIRRRLDDESQEVAQGLISLLWPDYLRPVPPYTVQQFYQVAQGTSVPRVPRGARVYAPRADGADGGRPLCAFSTRYDVDVPPFRLDEVKVDRQRLRSRLLLHFVLPPKACRTKLERPLPALRLLLAGEGSVPGLLLYFLRFRLAAGAALSLRAGLEEGAARVPLGAPVQVGFSDEESLLPPSARAADGPSFGGFRLLRELAVLKEKFLFLDLPGFHQLPNLGPGNSFWVEATFDAPFPADVAPGPDNFLLGCTPAVNLFPLSASIERPPFHHEHRVLPERNEHRHFEVHAVLDVRGWGSGARATERVYQPFGRAVLAQAGPEGQAWYEVRVRPDIRDQGTETWLVLSVPPAGPEGGPAPERLQVQLLCSNGLHPHQLRAGEVATGDRGIPAGVRTRNLGPPTRSVSLPAGSDLTWAAVRHFAVTHRGLANLDGLRDLLTLYNLAALRPGKAQDVHQQRMSALTAVASAADLLMVPAERLPKVSGGHAPRAPLAVRGTRLRVDVHFERFGGIGEVFLFGSVLEQALAWWANVNTSTSLELVDAAGIEPTLRWPPRIGGKAAL